MLTRERLGNLVYAIALLGFSLAEYNETIMKIHPYLNFDGNTEEAFRFYHKVFKTGKLDIMRFKEMPADAGIEVSAEYQEKIMHISLTLEDGSMLMGSDMPPGKSLKPGNNFSISISVASNAKAERLFNELGEGGKVRMPFEPAFWGSMFGMVDDRFGICWMVSSEEE